jgi:hypothetical protein
MNIYSRATRTLFVLMSAALVISVIHYVDNVVNYADYPQPGTDDLPAPPAQIIAVSWFAFTAAGAAGLWAWLRRRIVLSAVALMTYAVSGLVGIGHYLVPGATNMAWWRQAHVIADIGCGAAIFGFAVWAVCARWSLA